MSSGAQGKQKGRRGYRRLLSHQFSFSSSEKSDSTKAAAGKAKKVDGSKEVIKGGHPVLKVLDARCKEKAVMKPEFLRYLEYMREAGTWDPDSDRPTMYFK